ncbi:MAG: hypothetical protein J6R82_04910 [Clostridia bacterium]|nr:hypothetical protein [Clostridia bacterium]
MTATDSRRYGYRRSARLVRSLGGQIALLLLWGLICFSLCDGELLVQKGREALALCITRVIPVLFPIAAAGGLLTTLAPPPRLLCRPIGRLFGLSDPSVGVLLIALVSGFPIGAMLASRLLESERIEGEEASRLAAYTNNASAAFLVGCVGADFFGSARVGWMLWCSSTLAALIVGVWMGRNAPRPTPCQVREHSFPSPAELASSLKATGIGMLNLTAFVVFFTVFCAFLNRSLDLFLPANSYAAAAKALIAAVFEITGGLAAIAKLSSGFPLCMLLAGSALGWGGLSVFMQCMASGRALQVELAGKRLLGARIWIGLLSGIFAFLFALLWGNA